MTKLISWAKFKDFVSSRSLSIQFDESPDSYDLIAIDGAFQRQCILNKDQNSDEVLDFETNFKSLGNQKVGALEVSKLPPQQPFAEPTYRTKHAMRDSVAIVANGQALDIDYTLPVERYASGGTIVVKNPQFGDWFEASIQDPNGLIPEIYRPALCENWPCVATYIEGQYMELTNSVSVYAKQGIDTRPLVAKVSAGLVLRVTYHAADVQGAADREIIVNYFLAKKL